MPHSYGYRNKTRDLFQRGFRSHGPIHLSQYLQTIKLGEYVDIVGNGAVHKGMPHKFYHGRTGRVWNITPRAIGVIVNKVVRNRIEQKRIHVRIEHVRPSKCNLDFKLRVKENSRRAAAKLPPLKRSVAAPKPGFIVKMKKAKLTTLHPLPFVDVV
eukprot:GEZU01029134.1.p2 GENE.GEZU01029134.1~~GEZU01029134.1.p2  ORF type:complete len:156 (+),score=55.34 GEZU01029134.1:90-557(+)